ncbi:MAG: hypothetical protein ACD_7C00153G0002 [uncultured bacterium]|nr:MAG: hypothetical protein ACD_7C00153G0002 [uncultured bacterium]HBR79377.1 hypothetical protein [Candidatus Moranbacteria bacterium]
MSKKFIISSLAVLLIGGIFMASLAKGMDSNKDQKNVIYYDNARNSQIEVTFYKKVAQLSGKNFGKLKLENISTNEGISYKNERNNLILSENNNEVLISIGEKEVFRGGLRRNDPKDSLTKNIWLWKDLILKDDVLLKPINSVNFNLSFSSDGKILATTNCADFSGTYELKENAINIINLAQTKKFCDNSDGEIFSQSLKETASLAFDENNNLVLFLKNNAGSMSFSKK